ncbi:MAG: SusE domain-containing protein [Prevotellaceae bacterium]|jgi:hypothetical protein|nr:SusE domain-containing protein [Prevotellaceae bacterium]
MKNIYYWAGIVAAGALLLACEKSEEGAKGTPLAITGPTEKVTLLGANKNETAVTFTWNKGIERNPTDTITYIFRMDIAGNNFATASPRDTVTDFTKSFTVGELNELITQLWPVYPGEEVLLEARVVANVRGDKFVYPEIAITAFSVVTYDPGRVDDGEPIGYTYFADDFSWMTHYGGKDDVGSIVDNNSAVALSTLNMYSYSNADAGINRGDLVADFIAHGYTDINPTAETVYFASDYLKFGRTDVQSGIQGSLPMIAQGKSTNVTLTFDATPCITGSKNYDDVLLVVEIDGPGAVDVDDKITKRSAELDIQQVDKTFPWAWKTKSVVLYGITSATKITIKTNKSGTDSGTFRYYFDNLKFEKHSEVTP